MTNKAAKGTPNKATKTASKKTNANSAPIEAAYEVLARKYRPRNFDDLIGHEAMVKTLENAFSANRIAHAYILTGVRGVGKTTTARILARALNYQAKDGADKGPQIHMQEDGVHCEAIAQSRHPDVLEMDAASRTGVGDIRELIEGVRYAPVEARYKVYIIDEVHMLSTQAFNALLKTLEEPPPHVKFIFATTEIRKLPVTVLSRCQRFDLRRIEPETLIAHLEKIATLEGVGLEDESYGMIARAAEGSVRDALSILDQAIVQHGVSDSGNKVSADTIRDMLGLADRSQMWVLLDCVLKGDAKAALDAYRDQYNNGADPSIIVRDMLELVHLLTRVKAAGPAAAHHGPAGAADAQKATQMAEHLSMGALTRLWSLLMKGLEETRIAPDPSAAAEMALIRICYAADLPTPDEALRMLKAKTGQDQTGTSNGSTTPSSGEGLKASTAPQDGADFKNKTLTHENHDDASAQQNNSAKTIPFKKPKSSEPFIKPEPFLKDTPKKRTLRSLKDVAELAGVKRDIRLRTEIEGYVHQISFEPQRIMLRLTDGASADLPNRLMRQLKKWTGEHWVVVVSQQDDGDETLRARRHEEVLAHPMVKKAMDLFPGATIEKIREPVLPESDVSESDMSESVSSVQLVDEDTIDDNHPLMKSK